MSQASNISSYFSLFNISCDFPFDIVLAMLFCVLIRCFAQEYVVSFFFGSSICIKVQRSLKVVSVSFASEFRVLCILVFHTSSMHICYFSIVHSCRNTIVMVFLCVRD